MSRKRELRSSVQFIHDNKDKNAISETIFIPPTTLPHDIYHVKWQRKKESNILGPHEQV
jgi:hypothetical protein